MEWMDQERPRSHDKRYHTAEFYSLWQKHHTQKLRKGKGHSSKKSETVIKLRQKKDQIFSKIMWGLVQMYHFKMNPHSIFQVSSIFAAMNYPFQCYTIRLHSSNTLPLKEPPGLLFNKPEAATNTMYTTSATSKSPWLHVPRSSPQGKTDNWN